MALWAIAFVVTGLAAFSGGTHHGFTNHLGGLAEAVLWKATVYLIGIMSLMMLTGSLIARIANPIQKAALVLIGITFLLYGWWMMGHDDFKYVIYDYAPAMGGVLLLHSWNLYKNGRGHGDGWLVAGVLVSLGGAALQQASFSLHQHFNHNDIYHALQTAGMFLFYRGARLLKDSF